LGLFLTVISTIAAVISQSANKGATSLNIDILAFGGVSLLFAAIASYVYFIYRYKKDPSLKEKRSLGSIKLGIGSGVLQFIAFFTLLKAFEAGALGIVYTAHSLYIVIPILLAVVIYKEHFNIRKGLAVALSLVALFFLG